MKINVSDNLNPVLVIRRAGYGQITDGRSQQVSYVRRLGSDHYPRFHVYIHGQCLNLHLDQKKPSYQGSSAHSGEYEGETVRQEAVRLVQVAQQVSNECMSQDTKTEKKGFFRKLLG